MNIKILRNVYDLTTELYTYLEQLFNKEKGIVGTFDDPDICMSIRNIEDKRPRYDEIDFYKCQIRNKLAACTAFFNLIDFKTTEDNEIMRQTTYTKFTLLSQISKREAYTEKALHKLIISFPINPMVPESITEDFYNKLMEDIV